MRNVKKKKKSHLNRFDFLSGQKDEIIDFQPDTPKTSSEKSASRSQSPRESREVSQEVCFSKINN